MSQESAARVADRVRRGGHHIPEDDVRRRHARGMHNFVEVYRPLLDSWILFENTGESPIIIGLEEGSGPEMRDAVRYARFLDGSKTDE